MSIRIVVKKNTYFDSVSLMSISTRANKLDGVEQAFVAMATEMNKGVLKNLGLLTPELEEAKSGDLMIVIKGTSEEANRADANSDLMSCLRIKNREASTKHAMPRLPVRRSMLQRVIWR